MGWEITAPGKRYCTQCQSFRDRDGGKEKLISATRYRWVCKECSNRKARNG